MELTLSTPALLFSAMSLILLAYTNRFLSLAQLVRNLYDQYVTTHDENVLSQIKNLRKRLHLIRTTQVSGLLSLLLCVITMLLIYIHLLLLAEVLFVVALLMLMFSLSVSIWEIQISVKALDLHLNNMEEKK